MRAKKTRCRTHTKKNRSRANRHENRGIPAMDSTRNQQVVPEIAPPCPLFNNHGTFRSYLPRMRTTKNALFAVSDALPRYSGISPGRLPLSRVDAQRSQTRKVAESHGAVVDKGARCASQRHSGQREVCSRGCAAASSSQRGNATKCQARDPVARRHVMPW